MVEYLSGLNNIKEINLLPFHNSASSKYNRLNLENRFSEKKSQSGEEMELLKIKYSETGKPVSVGG
jgi:pyruvate-formate lyase-activating enzyme